MILKNSYPEIDLKNPFLNDKLKRAYIADNLTQLVKNITNPFVLSINSPWGTGKTTFVRMWNQKLVNENIPTIYFNAWESDYSEDPIFTFISEINTSILNYSLDAGKKRVAKRYLNKAKDLSIMIMKRSLPTVLKIATSGILDLDTTTESYLSKFVEDFSKEKIKNYESDKKNIIKFKENLTNFISTICTVNYDKKVPFVFFIDELDRCRPTYSIELLERVKHFFDIEGIIFVLSIDDRQIHSSIQSMYGENMDVDGYLRRFIDLNYNLPKPDTEDFINYLFEIFELREIFIRRLEINDKRVKEANYFLESFILLSSIFEISQRVQEQCFAQVNIVLRATPINFNVHPILLSFLIILKSADKEYYFNYCKNKIVPEKVLGNISSRIGGKIFLESNIGFILEAYILSGFTGSRYFQPLINKYDMLLKKEGLSDDEENHYRRLYELLSSFARNEHHEIVKFIYQKIEFTEQFNLS
jgi:hypothetical protein